MGSSELHNVYPLFSKDSNISPPRQVQLPKVALSAPKLDNAGSRQPDSMWVKPVQQHLRSMHSASDAPCDSTAIQLAPIFRPPHIVLPSTEATLNLPEPDHSQVPIPVDEDDLNLDRRKRRRTGSPATCITASGCSETQGNRASSLQPPSRINQLKETASLDAPQTQETEGQDKIVHLGGSNVVEETSAGANIGPERATTDPHAISLTSPVPGMLDGASDEPATAVPQTPIKKRTPKKKTLKLNANGKLLGSPQTVASPVKTSPRRGKGRPSKKEIRPSRMVVLRYDATAEAGIGGKIAEIVGRAGVMTQIAPVKHKGSPQPTHPFFLAKTKKQNDKSEETSPSEVKETPKITSSTPIKLYYNIASLAGGLSHSDNHPALHTSSRATTFSRNPDAVPLIWPPKEFRTYQSQGRHSHTPPSSFRRKATALQKSRLDLPIIPEDENLLRVFGSPRSVDIQVSVPARKLMSGDDCLATIDADGRESLLQDQAAKLHPAIRRLRSEISTTLSPFDEGIYDQLLWTTKYTPLKAEEVLQNGWEALFLRDWVGSLTINTVDCGSRASGKFQNRGTAASKRKRKKIKKSSDELDDFIISSDGEADELHEVETSEDELSLIGGPKTQRSALRTRDPTSNQSSKNAVKNAILLSGPTGSGKTASVHAVAKELGFEIFEINAGSRRSAKDIFDKVGDMTQNHIVGQRLSYAGSDDEDISHDEHTVQGEIGSGRQGTMTSFFKSRATVLDPGNRGQTKQKPNVEKTRTERSQKQSLILIEEADVLFEEDKSFWTAIASLIAQSKRPIILTCVDEALLPIEELSLEAILRYNPALESTAAEYLVTIAACEGHLISKQSCFQLYRSKNNDLRASIMEINYWCQMAVGSTKGSLDWMFNKQTEDRFTPQGQRLRVTSVRTYTKAISSLPQSLAPSNADGIRNSREALMRFADQELGLPPIEWLRELAEHAIDRAGSSPKNTRSERSSMNRLSDFMEFESVIDLLSAGYLGKDETTSLDPTQPPPTAKTLLSYCNGYQLVDAIEYADYCGTSAKITAAMIALLDGAFNLGSAVPSPGSVFHKVTRSTSHAASELDRNGLLDALACIEVEKPVFPPSMGRIAPSLESISSDLSLDIAPYVRYIAGYDQRLEQQREELNNMLSQGSRAGKRTRNTRASRAALEGGTKANTRVESWFHRKADKDALSRTSGPDWQELLLENMRETSEPPVDGNTATTSPEESTQGSRDQE